MINRLLLCIAAAVLPFGAQAQDSGPNPTPAPFGAGEELLYNVSYRAALIPPINMMRVSMRTFDEYSGGVQQFHIVGNGRTTGATKGIFELNDTYHAWLDERTLLPLRTTSDISENNYRLLETYTYDWDAMTVSNVRRNPRWEAPRYATFTLPDRDCGDALSLLYRMRAIDTSGFEPGDTRTLSLVLTENAKPITLRFIGREEVKIRRVGTFRALRFTCTMVTSDGSTYEDGMTLTAWVSDDANRIPLMIESPVRVGRVSVTIAEGFRTIYPLASFVK
jgi:hypothetical protein